MTTITITVSTLVGGACVLFNAAMLPYGWSVAGPIGAIFFAGLALLVGMPGLLMLLGARQMGRGDPDGARLARAGLSLPLGLMATATIAAPWRADPDYRWGIVLGCGAATLILLAARAALARVQRQLNARRALRISPTRTNSVAPSDTGGPR
ncbi:hypothetical protein AB0M43_37775 [Longispora sp. NPDC051575]|uniref:hypothetical protein n=1 Tax=Longispora sp. NPDC051575 TaxID=3154943 RepID=UPI00341A79AC